MKLTDVTALVRPIDPRYPTNLAISVVSLLVAVGGAVYRVVAGDGWVDALLWGVEAAFTVFLAWALARELDPDHDLSAFLAAALALVGLILFGLPSLLPLFWLLLLMRVVNRTTGLPARPLDTLGVLALAGWLAWQGWWVALLVTGIAFLLDGLLPNPLRRHLVLAGLALVAAVAAAVLHNPVPRQSLTGDDLGGVAALLTFSVLVVLASRKLTSVGDATGEPLLAVRVQAAQVLAVLFWLLVAWQVGRLWYAQLVSLWAALFAVGVWSVDVLLAARSASRRERNPD